MSRNTLFGAALAVVVGSSGWVYGFMQEDEAPQAFAQLTTRDASRIMHYSQAGGQFRILGQYSVNYSAPVWKDEYEELKNTIPAGSRLRLGKDYWTNLDTDLPLDFGGVRIEPGYYYLGLLRGEGDDWSLIVLDDDEVRAKKLDAGFTGKTEGGTLVPLTYSLSEDEEDMMVMSFDKGNDGKVTFVIQWGPHMLSAPVVAQL